MMSAEPPSGENGRLVANMRPVAHPAAPRRAPVSGRPAQVRRRETAKRRHNRSNNGPGEENAKRTKSSRVSAVNRISVGGLNISARMLLATLIVAVMAIVLIPTLLQWGDMKREYRAAVADGEAAAVQEERLQAELENWENPEYVSAQARARLGYVDPGETRYTVIDAPVADEEVEQTTGTEDWPPKPWSLKLQEQLIDIDEPPAVAEAARVETVPLSEENEGDGG